MLEIMNSVKN